MPKGKGSGPFPAVICWTSTTPDYTAPEEWWGKWLTDHGYVVLTGWSYIRRYREGSSYKTDVAQKTYERFGHWLPISRMVYDVRQEARYLASLPQVDTKRIGFMAFSLSGKTAVYVAGFAPEISMTIAFDPQIAVNGSSNWYAAWYMDWLRPFPDIPTKEKTVLSMLNTDLSRPGFEHDHHEVLALSAPKPFLLIGGSLDEYSTNGSDDQQSWGYINRAREVYRLLGVADRIQYVSTGVGSQNATMSLNQQVATLWRLPLMGPSCYNGEFVIESFFSILAAIRVFFRSRSDTALEVLALRQQVAVLKRKRRRPSLNRLDRLFWTTLGRIWSRWADVLVIVKPETVVAWHRAGFRLYWRWRSRKGRSAEDHR